jgi:hypothetical protein
MTFERYGYEQGPAAGTRYGCEKAYAGVRRPKLTEIMAAVMPPEVIEWHRAFAEAQRKPRNITLTCRRCHQPFVIVQRGPRHAQWPSICPTCHATRQRAYLAAWRARRRAKFLAAGTSRSCNGCGGPLPGGRADAKYCSNACRQRSYRQRWAAP